MRYSIYYNIANKSTYTLKLYVYIDMCLKAYNILRYGEKVDELVVTHFQATQSATIDYKHKSKLTASASASHTTTPAQSQGGSLHIPPPNVQVAQKRSNRVAPGLDK